MGKLLHIYCDESRQTGERYMALGGIIVPAAAISGIEAMASAYRHKHRMHAELKWSRVSEKKYSEYQQFVDHFFDLNKDNKMHFHAMLIDTHQLDHRTHNDRDPELGMYKFFYQLLIHSFGKKYCREGEDDRFIVKFDHRESKYPLAELKNILNNGMNSRLSIPTKPFHSVEAIDSKSSDLMQFTDVLLGAIGHQKNGFHLVPGARQAKINLAAHIAQKAVLPDLTCTPWGRGNFTIWNFRLQSKAKK
jgi:hypothetical protein